MNSKIDLSHDREIIKSLHLLDFRIASDPSYRPDEIVIPKNFPNFHIWLERLKLLGYNFFNGSLQYDSQLKLLNKTDILLEDVSLGKIKCKIPKILHICWVGERKTPSYFNYNISCWKKLMPDWDIKIWNNESLVLKYFKEDYLKLINNANNPAQKKDLIQWYVLKNEGGFFVDADVTPLRSLNELYVFDGDLFICHDLPISWQFLSMGIVGSIPQHKVFKYIVEESFKIKLNQPNIHMDTGPRLLGKGVFKYYCLKDPVEKPFINLEPIFYYKESVKHLSSNFHHFSHLLKSIDERKIFGDHTYEHEWK